MYKKILPLISVLIIASIIFYVGQKSGRIPKPMNTKVLEKEDENGHKKFREWIDYIHRAAPGVNWRTIDYETRFNKHIEYAGLNKSSSDIAIAGGQLEGKWRETGSRNLAGRTHLVEFDDKSQMIYCASSGGNIWKAGKNGENWTCLNPYFKINDINMVRIIDHNNIRRLLVSSGGWGVPSFYYSDNDGQTWNSASGLEAVKNWGYAIRSVVLNDPEKTIVMLAMEWDYNHSEKATCLYVSKNHGVSFTKISSFGQTAYGEESNFDIWTDYYGSGKLYFIENNNIYFLNDNTLQKMASISNLPEGGVLFSGCESGSATYLYVGVYASNTTNFYQSTNGGITWQSKGNVNTGPFFKSSFSCSQVNPLTLYYGGVDCFRSTNGGSTWQRINEWWEYYDNVENKLHADIPSINSFKDAQGNEFNYINTDGGTYISYNSLATVKNISLENLNVGQFYSVYSHRSDTTFIFGGTQDQGYQLCYENDGIGVEDFTQVISGDYGHIVSGDGGNSLWMVYPGSAVFYPYAATDSQYGIWWDFRCSGQFWIPPLMEDPESPYNVFLGGGKISSGTHIFHLKKIGNSITAEELDYDFSGTTNSSAISAMAYSPIDNNYRYVMNGDGEFFTSTDGGQTWKRTSGFNGPDGNYLYGADIVPSPVTLGKVYVAGSGYSNPPVYISDNNGTNFRSMSAGIPRTMVFEMAVTPDEKYLFAATEVGPYVYISEESKWYDLSEGAAPDQTYWTVDYLPATNTARFATYGRGIWDFRINNNITSIIDENRQPDFRLSQNYPNPFNPTTTIKYQLPSVETRRGVSLHYVMLKIYDILGNEIATLVNEQKKPGSYEVEFDASRLASGVYIYQLITDSFRISKKMVLIK